jgi:cytochrome b561
MNRNFRKDRPMFSSALSARQGYSVTQIGLHWLIAVLLVFNAFFSGDGMKEAWRSFERGADVTGFSGIVPQLHLWVGVAILAFALWRLFLRSTRGVPAAPVEESAVMRLAAHGTHVLLYVLMLALPLTGLAVYYLGFTALGDVHELLRWPLAALVLLHVAGALYQRFILKSSVLNRMMRPEA